MANPCFSLLMFIYVSVDFVAANKVIGIKNEKMEINTPSSVFCMLNEIKTLERIHSGKNNYKNM